MQVSAILLAAGKGKRFGHKVSKPLFKIGSKPILFYSLSQLERCPAIKEIIIVVNRENSKKIGSFVKQNRFKKVKKIVLGGMRRQDSVRCGLKEISDPADFVLIHDSARPLVNKGLIAAVLKKASDTGAAVVGIPAKATIKLVRGGVIEETLDRKHLWEIQTPQVFRKDLIMEAYRKFGYLDVTDDASLVEKLGAKVSAITGSYGNIKITTSEDAIIAEAILKNRHRIKH